MKEITRCKDCPNWKHGIIRENYCDVFDWCSDADDGCTFESTTDNKFRWHDLRKNPEDLPKDLTWCICKLDTVYVDEWYKDGFYYATGKYGVHWTKDNLKHVIAWKEIEPFEVEE